MKTIFDELERRELVVRLYRLDPDAQPRWGSMTGLEMLAHLIEALRHSLGEAEAERRGGPMSWPLVNWMVIHRLPWPKGKAVSPPEFLPPAAGDWNTATAEVETLLRRCAERGSGAAWPVSPAFGRISGKSWGVLGWRHTDHHLRQFGR